MRKHYVTILTLLAVGGFLTNCTANDTKNSSYKWYEETKAEILRQSDLKPDSTTFTFNDDSTFKREHFFLNGREFLFKGYNKDVLRLEVHYSKNHKFELRREICDNGTLGFEGITYKAHFYGLSTWRHCNGQLASQGLRYRDEEIGIWKTWNEHGKLIEEVDHKNIGKLDSMPLIAN